MARYLYIGPSEARAKALGLGWFAAAPADLAAVAAPAAVVQGAGQTIVISDSPPTTASAVQAAAAPIVAAEAATAAADAAIAANLTTLQARALAALTANTTFLALPSPTNAQTVAQVQTLTRECTALIRLQLGALDSTAGT